MDKHTIVVPTRLKRHIYTEGKLGNKRCNVRSNIQLYCMERKHHQGLENSDPYD
jgi:hypothetical protein